jgi:hypothetical protein
MYTRVTRDQFELRDGVFIHTPTQAEFTPHPDREDSVLVWSGNIGVRLPSGELFDYVRGSRHDEDRAARDVPHSLSACAYGRVKPASIPRYRSALRSLAAGSDDDV